jgi:hypothetical protein
MAALLATTTLLSVVQAQTPYPDRLQQRLEQLRRSTQERNDRARKRAEEQQRLYGEQMQEYHRRKDQAAQEEARRRQERDQEDERKRQEAKEKEERYQQQYEEAARERERQEAERKAKFVEQHEAAKLTYAQDVIAQVLNYSSTGYEDGDESAFWRKKSSCVYERVSYAPLWVEQTISNLKNVGPILGLSGIPDTLNLNELNFDEISFGMDRLPVGTMGVLIQHQGKTIVQGAGTRQMERLQRGWSLIYRQCPGVKKSF